MDIDDFITWALTLYRFAQSKDIDRGSQGYQVWRNVLAPVFFIVRTSRGEPFLTGDKSGVTKPNFNSVFRHSVNCDDVLLVR